MFKSCPFSTSLLNTTLWLFDNSHTTRCRVRSHRGFDLHLLMISDIEHLFIYLLAIYMFSLEKYLFRSCTYFFFNQMVSLFVIELVWVLDISHFSDIWFANVFYHSIGCIFISLIVSFAMQGFFVCLI